MQCVEPCPTSSRDLTLQLFLRNHKKSAPLLHSRQRLAREKNNLVKIGLKVRSRRASSPSSEDWECSSAVCRDLLLGAGHDQSTGLCQFSGHLLSLFPARPRDLSSRFLRHRARSLTWKVAGDDRNSAAPEGWENRLETILCLFLPP